MADYLRRVFDVSDFPPRWQCGNWTTEHGWLHILSDLGVWSAYLAIPIVLVFFTWRRRDLPFRNLFLLFGAFILACGTTHLMEAVIFWWPAYRLAGLVKLATAVISWATVLALIPITPRALNLRSPTELEREIGERLKAEAGLRDLQAELEARVAHRTDELARANAALTAEVTENARLYGELRDAERRKDEFLAMLSHELRNPLAPVTNALALVKNRLDDRATLTWSVEMMERQVGHMVRLVDDLLDVSRIMRGRIELRADPVELSEVVRRAVETARPLIDSQRHELTIDLPEEAVWMQGDLVRLTQVLGNLLNNAAKYTEAKGRIWLTARRENAVVAISVRDDGIGMTAEMLPKVFDLFMQADRSLERSQGGLGIGLTLVRTLTELHGGTVTVACDGPGKGCEFTVSLPALANPPMVAKQVDAPTASPPRRVLVVEDNVGAAKVLGKMLEKFWSHDVRLAHDGAAALEIAREFRPEVVLLDLGLPGQSGLEVVRQMRSMPEVSGALIAALTGYGQDEDRRRSLDAGFDEHLVKPPAIDTLGRLFQHSKLSRP